MVKYLNLHNIKKKQYKGMEWKVHPLTFRANLSSNSCLYEMSLDTILFFVNNTSLEI